MEMGLGLICDVHVGNVRTYVCVSITFVVAVAWESHTMYVCEHRGTLAHTVEFEYTA